MSQSRTTIDHDEIRTWAEARGAKPSAVKRTHHGDDVGIIRLDFPGYSGEGSLEEISWEQFFEKFEEGELALVYQEKTDGAPRSLERCGLTQSSLLRSSSCRSKPSRAPSSMENHRYGVRALTVAKSPA
jgi:hypothetical protein